MFAGLETAQAHPARRWTAIASFSLQAILVAAVLVVPLFRPASLPDTSKLRQIFLTAPKGVEEPEVNARVTNGVANNAPVFPILVRTGPAVHTIDTGSNNPGNITGPPNINFGESDGTIHSILTDGHFQPVERPQALVHHAPPVSVMMEGNLLRKVEPRYPTIAVQMGLQGTVLIKAMISREGTVEHPQLISGQPFLASAAMDAVKQWRYRPYYLNGQPVEVETEITVNFVLNR